MIEEAESILETTFYESPNIPEEAESIICQARYDEEDFFQIGDQIPSVKLTRPLRKGDILDVKILSVESPKCFWIKILGPEEFVDYESMKGITERMTTFYEKNKREVFLDVEGSLEGLVVACPYISSRNEQVEWRRAIVK